MTDSDKQALIDGTATIQTEIVVHNENLFPLTTTNDGTNIVKVNCTMNVDNNEYVMVKNNANAESYFGHVTVAGNTYTNDRGVLIEVEPNTDYYLTLSNNSFNQRHITQYNSDKVSLGYTRFASNSKITTRSNTKYISIRFGIDAAGSEAGVEYRTTVRFEQGTPVSLTETNSVIDWNHEDFRLVKEEGWIGQFVARQVTGNLHNLDDDFKITDKELELKLGVRTNNNTNWYSLGNFLVTKAADDEVTDKTNFEALDYTKKFNKAYEDTIEYPCTALQLAQNVCTQCGVALGSSSFKNDDYVIEGNTFTNNESCRDVMKAIGKLAFSWVRVDWDNKVYIDFDASPFKNLFDKNTMVINASLNASTYVISTNNDFRSIVFKCKPNTTYTIKKIVSNRFILGYTSDDNVTLPKTLTNVSALNTSLTSYTFTTNSDTNYVFVMISKISDDTTPLEDLLNSLKVYEEPSTYDKADNSKYYNLKTQKEVYGPVDKIIIGYSAIEGEKTYIGDPDGNCELTVYDNPLVYNQEQRENIINSYSDFLGMTYTPLTTQTVGHPWLKGNEIFEVTDMEGVKHNTLPLDRTIQYFGHIKTLISSETPTKTNDTLAYKTELEKQYARTEISVDKINKKIEQVIVDQSDTNTRLNQTISTLDGTIQRVSNTENTVQDITTTTQSKSGGNELYIEDALARDVINYSVDGATEQDGTPTPSSPQGIKTIPSIMNLCGIPDQTFTHNGVMVTIKDGEITLNGTATASGTKNLTPINATKLQAQQYTLSKNYISGSMQNDTGQSNFNVRNSSSSSFIFSVTLQESKKSYTFSSVTSIIFGIYVYTGVVYNNYKFRPMLEEGTVAHEYIPYGYWSRVKVTGKNLLDTSTAQSGYYNVNAISTSQNWYIQQVPVKPNTTYYLSGNNYDNTTAQIWLIDKNKNRLSTVGNYKNTHEITTTSTTAYIGVSIADYDGTADMNTIMLEEGSTATSYEPYKENEVLIDMSKPNLFDKDNANVLNVNLSNDNYISGESPSNRVLYIPIKENTTYTINKVLSSYFRIGTTTDIPTYNEQYYQKITNNTGTSITITTNQTAKYLIVWYYNSGADTLTEQQILDSIQIFEGTSTTPYYELCSTGDNKDRLVIDNNGNCSIEKNIGKVVLNGSETIYKGGTTLNQYFNAAVITNYIKPVNNDQNVLHFSSHFINKSPNQLSGGSVIGSAIRRDNSIGFAFGLDSEINTVALCKTWLSNNEPEFYYQMETPETITLSNTQIPLYEGINHITFVDDLGTNTSVTYYRQTPLSSTYATQQQLNDVSTEKSQEIRTTRNEVIEEINSQYLKISAFNETLNDGVPIVRTETGYTFDIDGLKIEKSDNDVKSQLDNDGLSVKYKGTDILTARSAGVNTVNMTVNKFYIQRPIRMEKTKSISDGSSVGLGFYYIGE